MTLFGLDSRALYLALVALVAAERVVELVLSKRHAARTLARGGQLADSRAAYAAMVAFHTLFLAAAPLEVVVAGRPCRPLQAALMTALLAGSMALRYWAIATLGERWNTRVIVVPGEAAIDRGPYRFLRHPNYVAVVVEMFALPLVHGAWVTALAASAGNALLLAHRIRTEERALAEATDYATRFGGLGRFLPTRR